MKTITLSILQFNTFVKNILDAEEFLSNISVYGEVTNFKVSGGNAYFDLKDENAMLSCVKFGANDLEIKNGDLITVFGKVNFYVKSGRLNFIVSKVQAYGMGDLYQKFLILKDKLSKEGLFDEEIKKSIPKFAKRIGVVTSETGAVIRDIINVTKSKNPYTDLVVFPSKVQGEKAEDELVTGIKYFNSRNDIDVIIVARGGGSIEDLAPFNTEKIVRAIYESELPIISAVGHETDFTLCDFASDLRVPTPSVAAEVAVFDYYEQVEQIRLLADSINYHVNKIFSSRKFDLKNENELILKEFKLRLVQSKENCLKIIESIKKLVDDKNADEQNKLNNLISVLSKLNPLEILKNGYTIIEKDGKRITSSSLVSVGDKVEINFKDGKVLASIERKE